MKDEKVSIKMAIVRGIEHLYAQGCKMPVNEFAKNSNHKRDLIFRVARLAGYNVMRRFDTWFELDHSGPRQAASRKK